MFCKLDRIAASGPDFSQPFALSLTRSLPLSLGEVYQEPSGCSVVRNYAGLIPGLQRSLGEGNGISWSVFLPGKYHGQRSLVCYSSWWCRVGHNLTTNHHHHTPNTGDPHLQLHFQLGHEAFPTTPEVDPGLSEACGRQEGTQVGLLHQPSLDRPSKPHWISNCGGPDSSALLSEVLCKDSFPKSQRGKKKGRAPRGWSCIHFLIERS